MNYFQKQLICCILSLFLIFFSCITLSSYHQKELKELEDLCRALPADLSDPDQAIKKTTELEEKIKKAGTSLAFFVEYDQLNEAYLCAATLTSAAKHQSESDYARASVALNEAIGTLLRSVTLSFETLT